MFRYVCKGHYKNENVYSTLGRTNAGRYLIIFFIYKITNEIIIVSARDMDNKEKKLYDKKKN